MARRLEACESELGTSLTNAVQLSDRTDGDPVTGYLINEAVDRGRMYAERSEVWPLLKRGILSVSVLVCATTLCWLIGMGIFGDVFRAVMPRLFDPAGDHPPYSRLTITVDPGPARVTYGGQLDIHATTRGAPVEKLYVEAQDERGVSSTVMFRRPDGSYLQTLTNMRETTRYWVTDGRARSRRYRIEVVLTPNIELIEYTVRYPAYTGLAERQRELDSPELRLPKRTVIDWRIASNRPLQQGNIHLTPLLGGDPRTVELTPTQDNVNVVTGSFEVSEALAYAISVVDVDGIESSQPYLGRVTIDPDRGPRLYVLEPGRRAVATPQSVIPVHVRAEDDYGVLRVLWFRGFNESIERPFQMRVLTADNPGRAQVRGVFDLADLGVQPGDRVEYFFEAEDNDPDGPNVATSRMYSLDIITQQEYEQILRQMMAQRDLLERYITLNEHLRRLAETAQATTDTVKSGRSSPSEAAGSLRDALDRYEAALDKALAEPEMFDVEGAFNEQLASQRRALQNLKQRTEAAGQAGSEGGAFERIANDLAEMAGQTNRNVGEPAQQIVQVVRLMRLSHEYVTLTHRQGELVKLTRRFEDQTGDLSRSQQMALQELAGAQQRIRDRLNDWLEEVAEAANELPDTAEFNPLRQQATAFCEAVRQRQIPEELSNADSSFAAMDGSNAYSFAMSAHEKMQSLIAQIESIPGTGQECLQFQPTVAAALGNTLDQIMAALGSGTGSGSANGYGLFGEGVSLYGQGFDLPEPAEGRGERDALAGEHRESDDAAASNAEDPALPADTRPARVSIQENVPFPLSYRELVGEYFRAVAEDESEQEP
jgi:hypothetical protein